MTMFLGVRSSEVCEWDTKPSATDPRIRKHSASRRRIDRGVQVAAGGFEASLSLHDRRLRRTRGRGSSGDDGARRSERDRAVVHERQARKATGDDRWCP
jgi:hypothetical protein